MESRKNYLDWLRLFAILLVIMQHVSAELFYEFDVNSEVWRKINICDGIPVGCVPLFVMMSGALMLNKDIPVGKIYYKYILRLVIAFLVWSVIYAIWVGGQIKDVLSNIVVGYYHMWFIPMIIGIYMCIPIIKKIVENEKICKYYILLSLVFSFVYKDFITIITTFGNESTKEVLSWFAGNVYYMHLYILNGYVVYFIMGHYLDRISPSKKTRMVIYACGILSVISSIVLNRLASIRAGLPTVTFYSDFSLGTLCKAIALFCFLNAVFHRRHPGIKLQ